MAVKSDEKSRKQRDALIAQYAKYVENVVGHLIRKMGLPSHLFDELVSSGYMGLVEAASRYNPNEDTDFKSYAYLRIRGSIIDSIRSCSELSGKGYKLAKALQAAHDLREQEFEERNKKVSSSGAQRKREELAKALDFGSKGVLAYRLCVEDVDEEISEQIREDTPEAALIDREQSELFSRLVETLPEKERLIIQEYYFNDKPFKQIVDENGNMQKAWVSKLHARALELLRRSYFEAMAEQTPTSPRAKK